MRGGIKIDYRWAKILPALQVLNKTQKLEGYHSPLNMNDAIEGKALNIKAKLFIPSKLPSGYKQRVVIFLMNETKREGLYVYGEFLNETEGEMGIVYVGFSYTKKFNKI